ncbi:MAG TPA: RimK/LysX family protein [Candidatus Sulfotelmatobacter sp.]|nr:RimK/LysX family protein [Candidatus Sulfotelmatobacter sp.]
MSKLEVIGPVAKTSFPKLGLKKIPARVDTGAKISAIWASAIKEKNGVLRFTLFAPSSPQYTGVIYQTNEYEEVKVKSTTGRIEDRYMIKLLAEVNGRKVNASFTLANRSRQVYPILIGRNILRGKFVVDIKHKKTTKSKKRTK